jgi:hypothetical protein
MQPILREKLAVGPPFFIVLSYACAIKMEAFPWHIPSFLRLAQIGISHLRHLPADAS